jgi:hypothetical protein
MMFPPFPRTVLDLIGCPVRSTAWVEQDQSVIRHQELAQLV